MHHIGTWTFIWYVSEIQQPCEETSAAAELRPALEQLQDAQRGVLRSVRLLPLPLFKTVCYCRMGYPNAEHPLPWQEEDGTILEACL